MRIQNTGFQRNNIFSDLALGIVDGLESAIWAYVFATIVFAGVLSVFVPVGLTVILSGWAIASLLMVFLSKVEIHLVCTSEQAIIILGSIAALMAISMGKEASTSTGLSTMLAVIALTSFLTALSFFLVAKLQLSHLLSMVPYPVVCGYMVGIVWLYFEAGMDLTANVSISSEIFYALDNKDNVLKLGISVFAGFLMWALSNRIDSPWVLPAMAALITTAFYGYIEFADVSQAELVRSGWLLDINTSIGGIGDFVQAFSLEAVNTDFILSVLPEIATVVFITTLTAAIDVSILSALNPQLNVRTDEEIMNNSVGLLACGLVCSPPAVTDASSSVIFKNFGARSRWMQVGSCAVLVAILPVGPIVISYVPIILLGAAVFMVIFQMTYEWIFKSIRQLATEDKIIISLILATVIILGFVEGVLLGIIVTALLFVLRYSFISAIHSQHNIGDYRSSVERSSVDNAILNSHANETLIVMLRGYLFFGTSDTIRETLLEKINEAHHSSILLDLRRVTGIDGSAMQVFRQIKQLCDSNGILLIYSSVSEAARERLVNLDAVGFDDGNALIFSDIDFAVEWLENRILIENKDRIAVDSVRDHIENILGDRAKAQLLSSLMVPVRLSKGDTLFQQGDEDNGIYVLESGEVAAFIDGGNGAAIRVKKFSAGALIGELSGYTSHKTRTATIIADAPSVLYRLDPPSALVRHDVAAEAVSAVHEMVARTLSSRLEFMNRRLIKEL